MEKEIGAKVQETETRTKEPVGTKEEKAKKVEDMETRREDTREKERLRKSSQW